MNKILISLMLVVCSIYLAGCMKEETKVTVSKNPNAEEVLRLDQNADIFQWEGLIYKTNIDWVNKTKLTKKESIGEITELLTSNSNMLFKDGMANKLPIGAIVYSTKEREDILIVEYDGKSKKYFALSEG